VAGVELCSVVGDRVGEGDPVAVIHARDEWAGERARAMAAECIVVAGEGGGGDA
jgi:thymidine phosphorylase